MSRLFTIRQSAPATVGFSAAAALVVGLSCGCGEPVAGTASTTESESPRLSTKSDGRQVLDLPTHVYDADARSPYRCQLPVTNETAAAVRFVDVRTSCGCTTADLPQSTLEPGETMHVPVELDVGGRQGVQVVHVQLVPDGGPSWKFSIRLPAYPRAAFANDDVFLGQVPYGESLTRRVELVTYATQPDRLPELRDFQSDHPNVTLRVDSGEVRRFEGGAYGRSHTFHASVAPRDGSASTEAQLAATLVGDGSPREVGCRLWWRPRPPVEVSPPRLFFGGVEADSAPMTAEVALTAAEGVPVVVRSVKSEHPAVAGRVSEDAGNRLSVRFDPRQVAGKHFWTEITVAVERPISTRLKIAVAAIVGGQSAGERPGGDESAGTDE